MMLAEQVRVRLQRGNFTGAEQLQRQLEQMAASFRMDAEHPCQRAIALYASLSHCRLLLARGQAPQACILWLRWSLIRKTGGQVNRSASAYALVIGLVAQRQNCGSAHDISASAAAG